MTITRCPNCDSRIVTGFDCKDFVHECNSGNPAIDQEDVVVVGDWEDWSGSGTVGPFSVMMQGAENRLFGTLVDIEGGDTEDWTRRGLRASTHRQRQHFEFIDDIIQK